MLLKLTHLTKKQAKKNNLKKNLQKTKTKKINICHPIHMKKKKRKTKQNE